MIKFDCINSCQISLDLYKLQNALYYEIRKKNHHHRIQLIVRNCQNILITFVLMNFTFIDGNILSNY